MNPREFCREAGYDKALLFTYEFDALFFERIVLRDLLSGGANDIQVVADLGRVSAVQTRWQGQVRDLGRRYRLNCATLSGAFHPKILLRTGPQGALIWIGSGNITCGGWGRNAEVGTAWRIGDGSDEGFWLGSVLRDLGEWLPAGLEDTTYQRILSSPWLADANELKTDRAVFVSRRNAPIGQRLLERWGGRKFNRVTLVTGSTDEKGALLSWFNQHLGVTEATVLLDPAMASFDSAQLQLLPMRTQLLALKELQRVHAKFYWLDGPSGPAAVTGSANCSAAAWLLPPQKGGNIESVVVYDNPAETEFASVLSRFTSEHTTEVVLAPKELMPEGVDIGITISYPVVEVIWDRTRGELTVTFATAPPSEATVSVCLSDVRAACVRKGDAAAWAATFDPSLIRRFRTLFVTVSLTLVGAVHSDQQFWVNDLAELRGFSDDKKFHDPIKNLSKFSSSSEQQKIIAALQNIGNLILNDHGRSRDPLKRATTPAAPAAEKEVQAPPIDPDELIKSLDDVITKANGSHGAFALAGVTLTGVIRALFQFPDEDAESHIPAERDSLDPLPGPPGPTGPPPPPPPPKIHPRPSQSAAKKLILQMESFFEQLAADKFAAECAVDQMIEATAYPLAIVAYGGPGGWIDGATGQRWTTRIIDILFYKPYANKCAGLLECVNRRNKEAGTEGLFRQEIGSGTLWAAVLAGVWRTSWNDKNGPLRKALTMRAVLISRALLSSADVGRVAILLNNLAPHFDTKSLLDAARDSNRILSEMESYIRDRWDQLIQCQLKAHPRIRQDDVQYHLQGGWAFAVEQHSNLDEAKLRVYRQNRAGVILVKTIDYCNISQAAENDPLLSAWLRELFSVSESAQVPPTIGNARIADAHSTAKAFARQGPHQP